MGFCSWFLFFKMNLVDKYLTNTRKKYEKSKPVFMKYAVDQYNNLFIIYDAFL